MYRLFNIPRLSLLLAFLILPSCSANVQKCDPPPAPDPIDVAPAATSALAVDVFIDATLSMQGFITDGETSMYQQTIPALERAVIKNGGQVNFFAFGTDIKDLPDRSYGDADKKVFYSDGSINTKTMIEKVIDRADTGRLTVVVTDLFQERSDINQLSEKIRAKFIVENIAVGVLGLKSQYEGTVYDVGTGNYSFPYRTSDETASYRPFYLLAFGKHADIEGYFDTLNASDLSAFPGKQQIIFSRYLVDSPVDLAQSELSNINNLNEVTGVLVKGGGASGYKEFRVRNAGRPASLEMALPVVRLPNTVEVTSLAAAAQSFVCDGSDPYAASAASVRGTMNSAFTELRAEMSNESINLKMVLEPGKLQPEQACGYRIIFRPKEFSMPAWVPEWDMPVGQVEAFRRAPQSFDGTKTYNLLPFFQTLWEVTRGVHEPKVADFYIYFRNS